MPPQTAIKKTSAVPQSTVAKQVYRDNKLVSLTPENVMMAAITFICTVFALHIFGKIVG